MQDKRPKQENPLTSEELLGLADELGVTDEQNKPTGVTPEAPVVVLEASERKPFEYQPEQIVLAQGTKLVRVKDIFLEDPTVFEVRSNNTTGDTKKKQKRDDKLWILEPVDGILAPIESVIPSMHQEDFDKESFAWVEYDKYQQGRTRMSPEFSPEDAEKDSFDERLVLLAGQAICRWGEAKEGAFIDVKALLRQVLVVHHLGIQHLTDAEQKALQEALKKLISRIKSPEETIACPNCRAHVINAELCSRCNEPLTDDFNTLKPLCTLLAAMSEQLNPTEEETVAGEPVVEVSPDRRNIGELNPLLDQLEEYISQNEWELALNLLGSSSQLDSQEDGPQKVQEELRYMMTIVEGSTRTKKDKEAVLQHLQRIDERLSSLMDNRDDSSVPAVSDAQEVSRIEAPSAEEDESEQGEQAPERPLERDSIRNCPEYVINSAQRVREVAHNAELLSFVSSDRLGQGLTGEHNTLFFNATNHSEKGIRLAREKLQASRDFELRLKNEPPQFPVGHPYYQKESTAPDPYAEIKLSYWEARIELEELDLTRSNLQEQEEKPSEADWNKLNLQYQILEGKFKAFATEISSRVLVSEEPTPERVHDPYEVTEQHQQRAQVLSKRWGNLYTYDGAPTDHVLALFGTSHSRIGWMLGAIVEGRGQKALEIPWRWPGVHGFAQYGLYLTYADFGETETQRGDVEMALTTIERIIPSIERGIADRIDPFEDQQKTERFAAGEARRAFQESLPEKLTYQAVLDRQKRLLQAVKRLLALVELFPNQFTQKEKTSYAKVIGAIAAIIKRSKTTV